MPTATPRTTWGGSLHSSWRILPEPAGHLTALLDSDGLREDEVLQTLPYDKSRVAEPREVPDRKRYRDARQVYQLAGLLYETDDGRVHLTALGHATRRWLLLINEKNARVLGRHAAFALAAAQLCNPTGGGSKYAIGMKVFPFSFIWRAMLALDDRISSDELNRALFRVHNEGDLTKAITRIRLARDSGNLDDMGAETETGPKKNDRIIPWMATASFGWTLIYSKSADPIGVHYTVPASTRSILQEAARVRHRHRDFDSVVEYVEHLAAAAALPKDLR